VWQQLNEAGPFAYRGSTGTSGPFMDWFGMPVGQTATYRARVANADDSVVGPWSADLFIDSP
jgi:hypothetical protein